MKLVQTIKELQSELDALRSEGKTIGLVPTMGALHAGHASLVKRAVAENDVVVVSDFVNPTQFNDKNDLAKYPRTLDADCELLEKVGAAFVFAPSVEEIYPEPDTRQFSYAPLDTVMEGRFRPGHFNGVCQIVSKLFMIVNPTRAYFGEKDFQQLAIIREMVRQRHFTDEIEINLDLLVVLIAVDLLALIDDHLVDELIEHGCGQLCKVRIAVYQLHEAVNIDAFFLFCVHLLHQLGTALFKLRLFRFILRGKLCVPLLR